MIEDSRFLIHWAQGIDRPTGLEGLVERPMCHVEKNHIAPCGKSPWRDVEKERKTKLAQLLEENCGWQVEHYSNLIPVAVDSLKYLSSLSFDILPFVMIEHLSGDCALHHCHFL